MAHALLIAAWLVTFPSSSDVKFVGSTPCDAYVRQFVGIRAGAECERISWTLSIPSREQGTFTLDVVYGMQANSAPGFAGGGTALQLRGAVSRIAARRPAYRLNAGGRSVVFVTLDPNLLHLLDGDGAVFLGNPGWSYTLSRSPALTPSPTMPAFQPEREARHVAGVFEGRTPCEALEVDLGRRRNPECTKAKWRITFRDAAAGQPGEYVLEGFGYRNPPKTGTWTTLRSPLDPETVVVQLDPGNPERFLRFRFVDGRLLLFLDKHGHPLAGDEYQSYTLNKLR